MCCIQKRLRHVHPTCPSSHRSYGHHLHVEVSKHTAQVEHRLSWWFLHHPGDRLQQERSTSHEETWCLVGPMTDLGGLKTRDKNRWLYIYIYNNDILNPFHWIPYHIKTTWNYSAETFTSIIQWTNYIYLCNFQPLKSTHVKALKPKILQSFGALLSSSKGPKPQSPAKQLRNLALSREVKNLPRNSKKKGDRYNPENQPLAHGAGGDRWHGGCYQGINKKTRDFSIIFSELLNFSALTNPPSLHLSTAPGLARACCTWRGKVATGKGLVSRKKSRRSCPCCINWHQFGSWGGPMIG